MNQGPHTPSQPSPPLLFSRDDVSALLGLPLKELTWWVYALAPSKRYRTFDVHRYNGEKPRTIRAPIKPIKDLQRTLATVLLATYEPSRNVHGFVLGRSAVSNARIHQRQEWVLRIDLEDFFPSINFGRVYGLFQAFPFEYPREVASLLAQICCFENELPQGAPTSPIISNFICRGLDAELARLALSERCYYSRYADDICFSTRRRQFPASMGLISPLNVHQVGAAVEALVTRHGFAINESKTRLVRRTQRQRVTGLVVNNRVNVDRRYVRSLRAVLHIWERYGEEQASGAFERAHPRVNWPPNKDAPSFALIIRGRIQHVGHVKGWGSQVYLDLARWLQRIDPSFAPRTLRTLHTRTTVRVYTEGPSDITLLTAAKAYFDGRSEFDQLRLDFPADANRRGSAGLLDHCEALAVTPQAVPCLAVFDRDDETLIRRTFGASETKDFGNNVFAVVIKAPEWRDDSEPLCIEMLFRDEDLLRRDENGRRLYLSREFDRDKGRHHAERVHVLYPKRDSLVREQVLRLDDGESVGLSKVDFADNVLDGQHGFEGIDFEAFRPTFELIQQAVARFSTSSALPTTPDDPPVAS